VTRDECLSLGLSGVLLRSTGVSWDLRKTQPYEVYHQTPFSVPCGVTGDSYERYCLRVEEMRQSCQIMFFCISHIPVGSIHSDNRLFSGSRQNMKTQMEALIKHFKFFSGGFSVPPAEAYLACEAPKGEFAIFAATNGGVRPVRMKFRAPGFFNLQALNTLAQNHLIADLVTIIGTIDIVFGEIDR
jgi:NADH:ubiquinone oxidoreductase subunit D